MHSSRKPQYLSTLRVMAVVMLLLVGSRSTVLHGQSPVAKRKIHRTVSRSPTLREDYAFTSCTLNTFRKEQTARKRNIRTGLSIGNTCKFNLA